MRKRLIGICLIIIMTFTGCGLAEVANSIDTSTMIYGSGEYTRINPLVDEHGEINSLIFNGLTSNDKDNEVIPCLAESWDIDESETVYIFHLRDDVKWHDGEQFTAEDVKFTIEAIRNPDNQSEIASNYEDIEQITIIDDKTIEFKLKEKNVAFTQYMSIGIVPEHIVSGEDIQTSDYFRMPVGTGPYIVESFNSGENIVLHRNEDYFKGTPHIEKIVFKFIVDDNAMALQLMNGEINLAKINDRNIHSFENNTDFINYDMSTADYRGIMYNFNNEKWVNNRGIIPAINYGIDREAIIESVLLGQGEIAYGPLQKNQYDNSEVEKYEYNPEKAKEIIESQGWVKNEGEFYTKNGEVLGFTIACMAGDEVRSNIGLVVAQQLKEIGIEVKVDIPSKIDWDNYEAYLVGWGSPFDADDHTYKVFGTDKGSNFNNYSNAKVDEYLKLARQSSNEEERKDAYNKFQEELANDPPYTFIAYLDANYVANNNLTGITEETVLGHHGVGVFWNIEQWKYEEK